VTAPDLESSTYFFSGRELARLAVYRAAVRARFYNDDLQPVSRRRQKLAGLPAGESPHALARSEADRTY
jgi:hypothetical protein